PTYTTERLDMSKLDRLGTASLALAGLLAVTSQAHAGTWTKVANASPLFGTGNGNMQLLGDGRVLISGPETAKQFATLDPALNGGYASGTWSLVGSSTVGRLFNPGFLMRDGRYWNCGGEYVSDGKDEAECEVFDPATNTWSMVTDMPEPVEDTPTA